VWGPRWGPGCGRVVCVCVGEVGEVWCVAEGEPMGKWEGVVCGVVVYVCGNV